MVDEVLALAFRGPRSYTREDVVELHTHGGPVCAPRVAAACMAAGARAARPGEFTLRAFLSGRLDLSQAEAVADLVTARTPAAVESALAGLGVTGATTGGVGGAIAAARAEGVGLLAEVSASLDFDEGDAPDLAGGAAIARLEPMLAAVEAALRTQARGTLLRAGLQVAIVGAPNVGKSSLLNALAGADRAIVSPTPGTTRDVVEAGAAVGGIAVTLLDTAGVRVATEGPAEADGVARSAAAAGRADVVALVYDGSAGWGQGDEDALRALSGGGGVGGGGTSLKGLPPTVLVSNKADLQDEVGRPHPPAPPPANVCAAAASSVVVSASTGAGLDGLRLALAAAASGGGVAVGGWGATVNARQADALTRARAGLAAALGDAAAGAPADCWSLGVREAVAALGEVSGDDATEEILDAVFSKFCVGK